MKPFKIKGSQKLTSFVRPMLATLTDRTAFDDPAWIFEIKWDGYRAIAELNGEEVRLYSRNGITFNEAYPRITQALKKLNAHCVLDGEIVVFDEQGKPDFQKMQNYSGRSSLQIQYIVFDCLRIDGKEITRLPLIERKALLKKIVPASGVVMYCDHITAKGKAFYQQIAGMDLEGMIAKKAQSTYESGKRSPYWLKIKNVKSQEAVIVGYTRPQGSRQHFGALLIASYQDHQLTSLGSVGTGFTEATLKDLYGKLSKEKRKSSPLDVPIKEIPGITWVNPVYVCQVKFTEVTEDGNVRHPVYMGLREDKEAKDVVE